MIVWLWDAGSDKGVTDDESHALKVAEVSMRGSDAATVRVERAVLVSGVCALTMAYRRTGMGWSASRVSDGHIAWEPLKAEREQATETTYA